MVWLQLSRQVDSLQQQQQQQQLHQQQEQYFT